MRHQRGRSGGHAHAWERWSGRQVDEAQCRQRVIALSAHGTTDEHRSRSNGLVRDQRGMFCSPSPESDETKVAVARGCTLPSTPTGCTTVHLAHISWVRTWTNRVMIRHEPHAKVDVDLDLTATLDPHLIILLPQRVLLVHHKFRPHTRILNFF